MNDLALPEMTAAEAERIRKEINDAAKTLQPSDVAAVFSEVAAMTDWQVKKAIFARKKDKH